MTGSRSAGQIIIDISLPIACVVFSIIGTLLLEAVVSFIRAKNALDKALAHRRHPTYRAPERR